MVPAAPPYSAGSAPALPGSASCQGPALQTGALGRGWGSLSHLIRPQNNSDSQSPSASWEPMERAARSGGSGSWGQAPSSSSGAGVQGGENKTRLCTTISRKDLAASESLLCRQPLPQQVFVGTEQPLHPSPLTPLPVRPGSLGCPEITASPQKRQGHLPLPYLASRNLDLKIITASQVLCLSCIWMELNFRWMMPTILSISLGEMGRVRLCSLRRFIT